MVGTRRCSEYGANVAEMLAHGLAASGAVIVSGMALGIDSYAHKGALAGDGSTVAVLGSGLDIIYPEENTKLYARIAEKGAVITEYSLGTRALKENFPARNRIIAGLSMGAIVVEAPERSGSLITAKIALEEGRDLFAVPGNIYYSRGSNQLLKECAKLVTEPTDVLEEYAGNFYDRLEHSILVKKSGRSGKEPVFQNTAPHFQVDETGEEPSLERQETLASETELSDIERKVKAVLSKNPKFTDEIIREAGFGASQTCAALAMLELKKQIYSLPGGRYYKQ
jgi:DNA processing protein